MSLIPPPSAAAAAVVCFASQACYTKNKKSLPLYVGGAVQRGRRVFVANSGPGDTGRLLFTENLVARGLVSAASAAFSHRLDLWFICE